MSYILDALDKAERERKRGQPPALHIGERPAAVESARSPWLWVAVFAVIFNALLAGLLIYSSTRETIETSAAPAPPAVAEPPPVVAAPAPPAPPLDPPIHRAIPPAVPPTVLLMTDKELQAQARQLEIEATPPADPAPIEPEPKAEPEAESKSEPAPLVATREADTPLERIPLLLEMSQQLQQSLPPFRVDVHVHASNAANRFVMINLRRYREGDEVAPELMLQRITKEGMVLKFRGEQFRYLIKN